MKIRAPIWRRLEFVLPVIAAIVIIGIILVNSYDHSGVSAAGMHGLTGMGQSSNHATVSNFPTLSSLTQMGSVSITKLKSPNNSPYYDGANLIRLTSAISYNSAERTNNVAVVSAMATVPMKINMKQNWELKCQMIIPKPPGHHSIGRIIIGFNNGSKTQGFMINGSHDNGNPGFKSALSWGTVNTSARKLDNNTVLSSSLSKADFAVWKNVIITYNAVTGNMSINYGGLNANSPTNNTNTFRTDKSNTTLMFLGVHQYSSGKNDGTYDQVRFQSFRYTNYDREITNTELQDSAGRKITGPVGSGHTITVKHNLKGVKDNKFFNANRQSSDNID